MGNLLNHNIHAWLGFLVSNIDPGLTYLLAAYGSIFALIGTHPIRVTDEKKLAELALIHVRGLLFATLVGIILLVIYLAYYLSRKMYGSDEYWLVFVELAKSAMASSWPVIPLFMTISWLTAFTWHRVLTPYLSNLSRRYRIRQSGDELSDIRVERSKLKSKDFNPRKFYKEGFMFLGLDDSGNPIMVPDKDFITRNMKVIGPTQTGKGVVMGVIIDQAIRKGWTTIFVNPKPDKFIPNIMRESCAAAGRKAPIQVDLNGVGSGKYGPFVAGTERQRRERLLWATGLNDDGGAADFYKANERSVLDKLLPRWDGSLESLHRLLHPKKSGSLDEVATNSEIFKQTARLRSYVTEWRSHKPLAVEAGRGFDIARTIRENGVAHIVSHTRDKLVKAATTVMLMDLIQSVEGLGSEPHKHVLVVVDEVKFVLSETLAAGLATVLDKGCNMIIAYQTLNDLLNLEDKRLNAKMIQQAVEVNCKYTLCYRAEDSDTAEWAAIKSGEINKKVAMMEKVEQNRMGAEHWANERTLRTEKENLLTSNKFLSLPDRTAGLFSPDQNAQLLYTCWVPIKEQRNPVEMKVQAVAAETETGEVTPPLAAQELAADTLPGGRREPTFVEEEPALVAAEPEIQPALEVPPEKDLQAIEHKREELRAKLKTISPAVATIDPKAELDGLLSAAHGKSKKKNSPPEQRAPEPDARSETPTISSEDLKRLSEDLSKL